MLEEHLRIVENLNEEQIGLSNDDSANLELSWPVLSQGSLMNDFCCEEFLLTNNNIFIDEAIAQCTVLKREIDSGLHTHRLKVNVKSSIVWVRSSIYCKKCGDVKYVRNNHNSVFETCVCHIIIARFLKSVKKLINVILVI